MSHLSFYMCIGFEREDLYRSSRRPNTDVLGFVYIFYIFCTVLWIRIVHCEKTLIKGLGEDHTIMGGPRLVHPLSLGPATRVSVERMHTSLWFGPSIRTWFLEALKCTCPPILETNSN